MPIGVIVNGLSVAIGGMIGALVGGRLKQEFKDNLNLVFGICSMSMGISSIVLMENMPAVVFAVIIGTALGLWIHLGERINRGAGWMEQGVAKWFPAKKSNMEKQEFTATLVTVIVLFCASGTGIYGSIISGMTGDHSILMAKSILDLFTALIFACSLGMVVSVIAIPQMVIFLILFFVILSVLSVKSKNKQQRIAAELAAALTSAKEANEVKQNFFSKMSHDIRTPLNVVLRMTQIAQKYKNDSARLERSL